MKPADETKRLLEALLTQLHAKQATFSKDDTGGILRGADEQLLGKIISNRFDRESIINTYGPYGSRYSQTSVFNPYSPYGSKYGTYSMNNPLSVNPPEIVLNGQVITKVSSNPRIRERISPEDFIATLNDNPEILLQGKTSSSGQSLRVKQYQAYIEANDGTLLGKLNPDEYDQESIFNEYGTFGSEYSPMSIFNEYSSYGGQYSHLSPFNEYSSIPPKIIINGQFTAYLTVNTYLSPRVDPNRIKQWARENIRTY